MQGTYHIAGMTCTGCQTKVRYLLEQIAGEGNVLIDLEGGKAVITSQETIPITHLQQALKEYPQYTIHETGEKAVEQIIEEKPGRSWWSSYKPLLILFGLILAVSVIGSYSTAGMIWMETMRLFMAGFFLSFAYFKLIDLKGFADSYAAYDVIARKFHGWGLIYPFLELGLGLAFASGIQLQFTLWFTLILMSVSIIGVIRSVVGGKRIRCACLGVVFDLPMSTVTIIEDGLMILMSAWMLMML